MHQPATTAQLHQLLDAQQHLPPETASMLTSHLPMALQALHSLQASAEQLAAFLQQYLPRFGAPPALPPAATVADWRPLRGRIEAYASLRASFAAALGAQGLPAVLRAALPELLPGAAAAAFHGPIRLAHAVEAGHAGEQAHALAYWAARWQPTAPPAAQPQDLPFDDWAQALVAAAPQWTPEAPLIAQRMLLAERSATYQALAGRLRPGPETLQRLTVFAAQRYAATRSFTVLHMATGLRALRLLLPWAGPEAAAAATPALVHACTAAYLAARMAHWPELPAPPARPWDDVLQQARASSDDHVIKIVHTCMQLAAQDAHPAYTAAALRAVA